MFKSLLSNEDSDNDVVEFLSRENILELENTIKGISQAKEGETRKTEELIFQRQNRLCLDVLCLIFEFITLDVDFLLVVDCDYEKIFVENHRKYLKGPKGSSVVNNLRRWISIIYGRYGSEVFLIFRNFVQIQRSLTNFLPHRALSFHVYSHEDETKEYLIDFKKVFSEKNTLKRVYLEETNFEAKYIDMLSKTIEELYVKSHRFIPSLSPNPSKQSQKKFEEMRKNVCSIWWPTEISVRSRLLQKEKEKDDGNDDDEEKPEFWYFNEQLYTILTRLEKLEILYLEYNKVIAHARFVYLSFEDHVIRLIGKQIKKLGLFGFSVDATILFSEGKSVLEEIKWDDGFIRIEIHKIKDYSKRLRVVDGGCISAEENGKTEDDKKKWEKFRKSLEHFHVVNY